MYNIIYYYKCITKNYTGKDAGKKETIQVTQVKKTQDFIIIVHYKKKIY